MKYRVGLLVCIFVQGIVVSTSSVSYAENNRLTGWEGSLTVKHEDAPIPQDLNRANIKSQTCTPSSGKIYLESNTAPIYEGQVCYYQKPGWRYTWDAAHYGVAVSLDDSETFYVLSDMPVPEVYTSDNSMIFRRYTSSDISLWIVDNFLPCIIEHTTSSGSVRYDTYEGDKYSSYSGKNTLISAARPLIAGSEQWMGTLYLGQIASSNDGAYLAIPIANKGALLLDRADNSIVYVAGQFDTSSGVILVNLSRDGRTILLTSHKLSELYKYDGTCGVRMMKLDREKILSAAGLPDCSLSKGNFDQVSKAAGVDFYRTSHVLKLTENSVEAMNYKYDYKEDWIITSAKKTTISVSVPKKLEKSVKYIALGDSFSSGQGNLAKLGDGQPGYRFGTNNDGSNNSPRERCRVSEASYPYRLAASMGYGPSIIGEDMVWASVACSGAVVDDISGVNSAIYKGQAQDGKPRLIGFDVGSLKNEALAMMIPGRQKQIEFVKKYKPKAVTISIGGNDVQFGDIIRACVQPIGRGAEWTSICSYAKSDEKKANLAYSIIAMRNKLIDLYNEIKSAGSPDMKIYVIGYPIFTNQDVSSMACQKLVRLRREERQMANEATKFMNLVARSAAEEAGAIFIDMETSLGEHVLCGSSSDYAINAVVLGDTDASFHPNSYGHSLMADRIKNALGGETFDLYSCHDSQYITCPGSGTAGFTIPNYFKQAIDRYSESLHNRDIVQDIVNSPAKLLITIADYTVGPDNPVEVIIYSEKRSLGVYRASTKGGLNVEVDMPSDLPYGYHTVEIISKDNTGKDVKLWKIIEVRSPDPKDFDGDGIPNESDENQYKYPVEVVSPITLISGKKEIIRTAGSMLSRLGSSNPSNASEAIPGNVRWPSNISVNDFAENNNLSTALSPHRLHFGSSFSIIDENVAHESGTTILTSLSDCFVAWFTSIAGILLLCGKIYQTYKHRNIRVQ